MSRYLRLAWLLMGIGSFLALIAMFLLPTRWVVERHRDIAAPAGSIYPLLVDLQAWKRWSPWQESAYPGLVFRYHGPRAGPGAAVWWNSEGTGDGMLRIESSHPPRELTFGMRFQHGRIRAHDALSLQSLGGDRTRVTWTDRGDLGRTLLGRLSLRVVEASMSRDLDRGLAALAAVVEGRGGSVTAAPAAASPAATPPP